MKIRKLQYNDLNDLGKLYKGFWNEDSDLLKMQETYKKIDQNPNFIVFNALINNRIIGTISGTICFSLYGNCEPFLVIEDFIVDQNERRNGIGKELLKIIEDEARLKGCNQVILVTDTNRKDSQAFYESQGYPKNKNVGYKKKLTI